MTWNESSVAGKQWEVSPRLLRARYCVGTLPHLPARPLTHYLEGSEEITLTRAAGARMKPLLASGEVDTALLPTNDLGCFGPRMSILPVASLSGDESSLYARIFSQVDPADITVLWADRNCGSALGLLKRFYKNIFNRRLRIESLARTDYFGSIEDYIYLRRRVGGKGALKSFEVMIHPKLGDKELLIDGTNKKPLEEVIKAIDSFEDAISFSGAKYQ